MSTFHVAGSTQYLSWTSPKITNYPFTVGIYVKPNPAGNETFWCLGSTSVANHHFALGTQTTGMAVAANAGGSTVVAQEVGVAPTNDWYLMIGRFISATNRRMDLVKTWDGSIFQAQNTTSTAPANIDTMAIGARVRTTVTEPCNGYIGEFWYTNTDIQADAGATSNDLLRTLRNKGPFGIPHIASNVIEYHSLRETPDNKESYESYYRDGDNNQIWTNTGGVIMSVHPPLTSSYVRIHKVKKFLAV